MDLSRIHTPKELKTLLKKEKMGDKPVIWGLGLVRSIDRGEVECLLDYRFPILSNEADDLWGMLHAYLYRYPHEEKRGALMIDPMLAEKEVWELFQLFSRLEKHDTETYTPIVQIFQMLQENIRNTSVKISRRDCVKTKIVLVEDTDPKSVNVCRPFHWLRMTAASMGIIPIDQVRFVHPETLPLYAWTDTGPLPVDIVRRLQPTYGITVRSVGKNPLLIDYIAPVDVEIDHGAIVHLGAFLSERAIVKHGACIELGAWIGMDAVIEGTVRKGCKVGDNSIVAPGAVIEADVGKNCRIGYGSYIGRALEDDSIVAPGAILHPSRHSSIDTKGHIVG